MNIVRRVAVLLAVWALGLRGIVPTLAGEPAAGTPTGRLDILNLNSYVRLCVGQRTPVYAAADGSIKIPTAGRENKPLEDFEILPPNSGWPQPEFDDAAWFRGRLPVETFRGNYDSQGFESNKRHLILLRARFRVDDPAGVKDLRLSLPYIGGVVVYVNGKELARGHLPEGALKPETLAQRYADDPYTDEAGKYFDVRKNPPARYAARWRKLEGLAIPAELLRKGVNVLSIEVHRAPIHEAQLNAKRAGPGRFAYVGVGELSLTAAPGSAVQTNVGRPAGLQVWSCSPFAVIGPGNAKMMIDWQEVAIGESYGDPCETPRVTIVGTQNGVFSGRLVASSTEGIRGLQVKVSDLAQAGRGAKLPGSAIRVRCAMPATPDKSWVGAGRFDALEDTIPAEISSSGNPKAAMAPIWLSARIPQDAAAGTYEGQVTVTAEGQTPAVVPMRVVVHAWRLADPKDFRMKNLTFHSPESVAKHYELPLWSDKHFEYIGKVLALMGEVNARRVFVNLGINWYGGSNEETVVRWIKQPDGSYKHDFTVFDKYLDTVAKSIGKPLPLRVNALDNSEKDKKTGKWGYTSAKVSQLDPATGKVEPMDVPPPEEPDSPQWTAFWKPVLAEVRKRIEARGWWDVTCLGHNSYCYDPSAMSLSVVRKIWPDAVWGVSSHNAVLSSYRCPDGSKMPIRYAECVWSAAPRRLRGAKQLLKARPGIWNSMHREGFRDGYPLLRLRLLPEDALLRGHDGVGNLGADNFPIKRPKGGYYFMPNDRGGVGPSNSTLALLAPGADGPVATERFEAFREGVQFHEGVVFLERALAESSLPADLAGKVNGFLDRHSRIAACAYFSLDPGYGWLDVREAQAHVGALTSELFALCAETAQTIGSKREDESKPGPVTGAQKNPGPAVAADLAAAPAPSSPPVAGIPAPPPKGQPYPAEGYMAPYERVLDRCDVVLVGKVTAWTPADVEEVDGKLTATRGRIELAVEKVLRGEFKQKNAVIACGGKGPWGLEDKEKLRAVLCIRDKDGNLCLAGDPPEGGGFVRENPALMDKLLEAMRDPKKGYQSKDAAVKLSSAYRLAVEWAAAPPDKKPTPPKNLIETLIGGLYPDDDWAGRNVNAAARDAINVLLDCNITMMWTYSVYHGPDRRTRLADNVKEAWARTVKLVHDRRKAPPKEPDKFMVKEKDNARKFLQELANKDELKRQAAERELVTMGEMGAELLAEGMKGKDAAIAARCRGLRRQYFETRAQADSWGATFDPDNAEPFVPPAPPDKGKNE